MRFNTSYILLLALPSGLCHGKTHLQASVLPNSEEGLKHSNHDHRKLQTASCLATTAKFTTTSFTTDSSSCTPTLIKNTISTAMAEAGCTTTLSSELAILLNVPPEDDEAITAALQAKCDAAFQDATLDFQKITKRGDAFDREFFAGGSDWNDQYEVVIEGEVHHVLKEDASRIMYESRSASARPMEFPTHLPAFDNCSMGAVMCCHVADRQANDLGGLCEEDNDGGSGCANANPLANTDVCVASMADARISNRVERGLAVYHLNNEVVAAEGNVNCHGFAWDSVEGGSVDSRYRGNMLFDVAFKQSLYDKGYVKNIPGAPMCGCIEQMPTVTRSDCTKITSVSETYTLSITSTDLIGLRLTDADVQYSPCDADEDLSSHYKQVNAANTPTAIDAKLVGEGNCLDAIDTSMQAYGYKRSVLEVRETYLTPPDVSPARVTVKFNTAVSDAAASIEGSFKVYDAADPTLELAIKSAALKYGGTAVELTLSSMPSPSTAYKLANLVTLHKKIAPMVTLEPTDDTSYDIATTSWDYLRIGTNWRLAHTCESCSNSHFSVSSSEGDDMLMTSQIFRDTGTTHPGPRSDFNGWDNFDANSGPTYSTNGIVFGDYAVQVRDWRIKQIDETHLSISNENGNVARIYRSDGTVHGNNNDISGYNEALGEPTCAYLTESYLQIGDWRFGAYDAAHLSVSHRLGQTAMIYRTTGTIHKGPRRDYNIWTLLPEEEEVLLGSREGCAPLDLSEPNVLQIGRNWKLAQMYDGYHFSMSAREYEGGAGNNALTSMIYRHDGKAFRGPRTDYNAWGEIPTFSKSPPKFGFKTLEIDQWRIRQIDGTHLSITHKDGDVARIYRSDGTVHGNNNDFSGYTEAALGEPTCAFLTEKFLQLGDWRLGEYDDEHFSVSHRNGNTSYIYKRDGTAHPGPRTDYNPWDFAIGTILRGSVEGCASIVDAIFPPPEEDVSPAKIIVEFNRDLSAAEGIKDSFKIYDAANTTSLAITAAALKSGDDSILELTLSSVPSSGISYQVSNVDAVPTRDPIEIVPAGSVLNITVTSWDYLQIGNWRLARTCETCSSSHFSVSSDNMFTSQIFRDTGTTHRGPMSDFNGWDVGSNSGPTYSASGVQFGKFAVQVRDWRIKQMDQTHLSISHTDGNVARIYRSDGTVHGNVQTFSGYNEALGEPTCAYLTDTYLQIGDWRVGAYDASHLSVSHRLGQTSMIYRTTGTIHRGPRTDFNTWTLPEGEVLLGSNEGCGSSSLFA